MQFYTRVLSKRYSRDYAPIYSEDDVYSILKLYTVYNQYDTLLQLDDIVSFQWLKNSHCVGTTQLQLILNDGVKKKKVLYTSDIGALETKNHYAENTEISTYFNDVIIMESTYGLNARISKKTREFGIEYLGITIDTVLERHDTLVLPAFSSSRSRELLTILFLLFGDDENFTTPIIMDLMLICDICDDYGQVLQNDSLDLWNKAYSWKNVKYIREKSDSQSCVLDTTPKIRISSSGFYTNDRILSYLDRYLRDINSMICSSGYIGDDESYLSYRIKNGKSHKIININKEPVPNRADCVTMQSFSSHANFSDLLRYGSNLRTNQLVPVHDSIESKNYLKKHLEDGISRDNKTYKMTCSERNMIIPL